MHRARERGSFPRVLATSPTFLLPASTRGEKFEVYVLMAEEEGFEPPEPFRVQRFFKTAAFNHSAIPPFL